MEAIRSAPTPNIRQGIGEGFSRQLCGARAACNLGCKFCFASFTSYEPGAPLFQWEAVAQGTIIYPVCDSEFFADREAYAHLEGLARSNGTPLLVSISTRTRLSKSAVGRINGLNAFLAAGRGGFVKVSVSISAKSGLREFEPRTSSYNHRLETLALLNSNGIAASLNIKPLLPQVDLEEYKQVVLDTLPYTKCFLLGGLYLDPHSLFGKLTLRKYSGIATRRRVSWLPRNPIWPYIYEEAKARELTRYINDKDGRVFQSDVDVMSYFVER